MSKRHILLLEKEQGLERILTLMLKQANFEVSRCRKAETVIARMNFGEGSIAETDLLIIDMAGTDCEGARLLEKLKRAAAVPPTILITPYGSDDPFEIGPGTILPLILHSPFEPADLMSCIDRATDQITKLS